MELCIDRLTKQYGRKLAVDRLDLELHQGVYTGYFSPAHMERYIQLPLAPGEAIHPAPRWMEEDDEEEVFP